MTALTDKNEFLKDYKNSLISDTAPVIALLRIFCAEIGLLQLWVVLV